MAEIKNREELIEMNKQIKRKLQIDFSSKYKMYLMDSVGSRINATPFGVPHIISVSNLENPFPEKPIPEYLNGRSFFTNFDGKVIALSREELAPFLGADYHPNDEIIEINASLDACVGGPGLANAYVLGGNWMGVSRDKSFAVIPVQYYQISKEDHERLAFKEVTQKSLETIATI